MKISVLMASGAEEEWVPDEEEDDHPEAQLDPVSGNLTVTDSVGRILAIYASGMWIRVMFDHAS